MTDGRMNEKGRAAILRIVTLVLVLVLGAPLLDGQTHKRTSKARRTKTVHAKPPLTQKADSVAAADSLRRSLATASHTRGTARDGSANSEKKSYELRKIPNEAFTVGERLEFEVNYGFITAGDAAMTVPSYETINGRRCYRVEFTVNSLPSFAWVYKVDDRYLTFIDTEAIAPWRFEQHISEGTYRRDFIADFDQIRHVAKTTEGEYTIPEYVHDIMSAFYYARTIDFSGYKPGDQTTLYNFYKDKSYELVVRFLGRQELEVEAGTFNTVVVEPLVKEGGLFKSEGRIVIWLTDDERKMPVRVNTKVVIGSIDVELKGYTGLAGPLKSLVK